MKPKLTGKILFFSTLLALLVGSLFLRFDRFKLIKCLRDVEKERDEVITKGELTPEKIISIEQTMDKKRDGCFELYRK